MNKLLRLKLPSLPPPRLEPSRAEGAWLPPLDLLSERRRELALEPFSGLLTQRPALIRRGLLSGGLILAGSLGLCVLLLLWHQVLKGRMGQLVQVEGEVERLSKTLVGHRAALKRVKDSNERLVKRLIDVRSSSALLADLQLRVPEGVQLTSVEMVTSDKIQVVGIARDPVAFGRVNAMELVLRSSPLFQASGVTISRVERDPARVVELKLPPPLSDMPGGGKINKLMLPSAVRFEMTATLAPMASNQLLRVMEELEAEGMARRLRLLRREGLLP
ncbi:MAG: PilN domain-containing protein [Cyanobacteriota bacterium]|nr:PilN domain-containing protein [Cyanobacteriota bacterium]